MEPIPSSTPSTTALRIVSWNIQTAGGISRARSLQQQDLLRTDPFFQDADVVILQEWRDNHHQGKVRGLLAQYPICFPGWTILNETAHRMLIVSKHPICVTAREYKRWVCVEVNGQKLVAVYLHPSLGRRQRTNSIPTLAALRTGGAFAWDVAIGDFCLDPIPPIAPALCSSRLPVNSYQPQGGPSLNLDCALAPQPLAVTTLPGLVVPGISDHLPISAVI